MRFIVPYLPLKTTQHIPNIFYGVNKHNPLLWTRLLSSHWALLEDLQKALLQCTMYPIASLSTVGNQAVQETSDLVQASIF